MKRRYDKYPLDLLLLAVALAAAGAVFYLDWPFARLLMGAPLVVVLPGYCLCFLLFPERRLSDVEASVGLQDRASGATTEADLDRLDYLMRRQRGNLRGLERVAVSMGSSLAMVGFIGIALDLLGIGVFTAPFLGSILGVSAILAIAGVWRWYRLEPALRWALEINWSTRWLGSSWPGRVLSILLLVAFSVAAATVFDELVDPDPPGRTRLYLLGQLGDMRCYPSAWEQDHYRSTFSRSERECPELVGDITVGIINLERQTTDYWVRMVWSQGFDLLNDTPPATLTLLDEWQVRVAPHPEADVPTEYARGQERLITLPPPPGNGTWRLDVQIFLQEPGPVETSAEYLMSPYRRTHIALEASLSP